jgi:hypothetical protein
LLLAQASLDCDPPNLMLPIIIGMTGACHHAQLLTEWGSC